MVGSTFRLLPAAKVMSKYLPLDTISLRYVAWEVLVEVCYTVHPSALQQHCICIQTAASCSLCTLLFLQQHGCQASSRLAAAWHVIAASCRQSAAACYDSFDMTKCTTVNIETMHS